MTPTGYILLTIALMLISYEAGLETAPSKRDDASATTLVALLVVVTVAVTRHLILP